MVATTGNRFQEEAHVEHSSHSDEGLVLMQRLADRVAVVTGAANGIGRALAVELAAEGMKVVLADIEAATVQAAAEALAAEGAEVHAVPTDVSDAASVAR